MKPGAHRPNFAPAHGGYAALEAQWRPGAPLDAGRPSPLSAPRAPPSWPDRTDEPETEPDEGRPRALAIELSSAAALSAALRPMCPLGPWPLAALSAAWLTASTRSVGGIGVGAGVGPEVPRGALTAPRAGLPGMPIGMGSASEGAGALLTGAAALAVAGAPHAAEGSLGRGPEPVP
eukprot:CAMPEP_0174705056 /NCGR_PEP_ID=MMETSP1094-20130205/8418_1 /TAXON_ID=156173 /ORGANISM="Chrysochromulina brevifilum, Strain UTEX LB 985" /LENGTH=176 /DNA_ID=CAMNT_0015903175 /DNA_START=371 /DNA_END=901 /DNA_ORIENTATION=+